jgi:hypothetical protein
VFLYHIILLSSYPLLLCEAEREVGEAGVSLRLGGGGVKLNYFIRNQIKLVII